MATWTLVYRRGVATAESPERNRNVVQIPGEMISTQVITVGSTAVAPPVGTQIIEIIPDDSDGAGFFWISQTSLALDVDATHHRPVKSGEMPIYEEWRNNYEFQHVASLS